MPPICQCVLAFKKCSVTLQFAFESATYEMTEELQDRFMLYSFLF